MTCSICDMKMFVRRNIHGGRSIMAPCTIGVLSPADGDAAVKLHNAAAHGLSRDIFAPSTEEEVLRFLGKEGLAVGVRFEDRLVCLRTLKTGAKWVEDTLSEFGLGPDTAARTAITGFCVVDKEFRGNNIQFLSQYYAENIIAQTFDSIVTTVSPKNIFSLQNVLACGFYIVNIKRVYGELLRYVLKKDFYPKHPVWTHGHLRIPIRKIEEQQQAIAAGNVGYKIIRRLGGFCILYGYLGQKTEEQQNPNPTLCLP